MLTIEFLSVQVFFLSTWDVGQAPRTCYPYLEYVNARINIDFNALLNERNVEKFAKRNFALSNGKSSSGW